MNEEQERLIAEAEAKLLTVEDAVGLTLVSVSFNWYCGSLFLFGHVLNTPRSECRCLILDAEQEYDEAASIVTVSDFTHETAYAMLVAKVISKEHYEAVCAKDQEDLRAENRERDLAQLRRLKWKYETEDA